MKLWFERGAWASGRARQKLAAIQPETVKSIAVIRHAALGDMVLVRAFIRELRRNFPAASITLSIVSNYTYGTPKDMVDRVHVVYGSDQRHVPKREQIRRIKELGYHDLLFDLAATPRSFQICMLNKAGLKIGFPYYALQRRLFYDVAVLRTDLRFEAEIMLDMLNIIGIKTDYPPKFELPAATPGNQRPFIVYFTSASVENKCWPASHFSELVSRLAERYPEHEHIVLEGTADWESIDEVMKPLAGKQNTRGMKAVSLDGTIALLQGAALLISNDTGIRNLAIATETPTLGIFFVTVPFRYWPRYGKHDVVFEPDGSVPPVTKVMDAAVAIMEQ